MIGQQACILPLPLSFPHANLHTVACSHDKRGIPFLRQWMENHTDALLISAVAAAVIIVVTVRPISASSFGQVGREV